MTQDIAALLASRICHDLISPIGAIANGVELLAMTDTGDTPEVQLIGESVANATARVRFFRVAYGMAAADQRMAAADIRAILDAQSPPSRIAVEWQAEGEQPRTGVKLVFLLIQCLETALPFGGRITVTSLNNRWTLDATFERMSFDDALWGGLERLDVGDVSPAQVQFALAASQSKALGRQVRIDRATDRLTVSV